MDFLTPEEMFEGVEAVIAFMEQDEHRYYVALELAYQLRDELGYQQEDDK